MKPHTFQRYDLCRIHKRPEQVLTRTQEGQVVMFLEKVSDGQVVIMAYSTAEKVMDEIRVGVSILVPLL